MAESKPALKSHATQFRVRSKLGQWVRTTKGYWQIITRVKHPSVRGKELQVKETLQNPDEVRISKRDDEVFLFYKNFQTSYLCVVVRSSKGGGFIVTAYWTQKIKEGLLRWKK